MILKEFDGTWTAGLKIASLPHLSAIRTILRQPAENVSAAAFQEKKVNAAAAEADPDYHPANDRSQMNLARQRQIKANLKIRARVIQAVREYFIRHDYLEIETPCRIPAPIPEAHIEAENSGDWYLQTSPEICMKPLLSAGFSRIFQICRCFRRNERGAKHLPEMTLLEWYCAGMDYFEMMTQCENLLCSVSRTVNQSENLVYQGNQIDLNPPWDRLTVARAFERYAALSLEQALTQECFDEVMSFEIEPRLGLNKPVFLFDYPAAKSALAKLNEKNAETAKRFELYISGLELCNAFSELNDPVLQQKRFEAEQRARKSNNKELTPLPENFLKALAKMPDAVGNALGIDRLVMLFADTNQIDDVVAFTPEEL